MKKKSVKVKNKQMLIFGVKQFIGQICKIPNIWWKSINMTFHFCAVPHIAIFLHIVNHIEEDSSLFDSVGGRTHFNYSSRTRRL